jgi:hypothetical protein
MDGGKNHLENILMRDYLDRNDSLKTELQKKKMMIMMRKMKNKIKIFLPCN